MKPMKVGEIARRAGVSVRTLHYYEEIGLLTPERTESGHRQYGRAAIERLLQIRSLQQLGFSLTRIDSLFSGRVVAAEEIVADHLTEVQMQREALARLEVQLQHLHALLQSGHTDETEAVDLLLNRSSSCLDADFLCGNRLLRHLRSAGCCLHLDGLEQVVRLLLLRIGRRDLVEDRFVGTRAYDTTGVANDAGEVFQ